MAAVGAAQVVRKARQMMEEEALGSLERMGFLCWKVFES